MEISIAPVRRFLCKLWKNTQVHSWIGSLATVVQAGAVVWGVWLAIQEISERRTEMHERQIR